jgi:lupus La protein
MTDFVYQGEDFDDKVRQQVEFYFSDSNLQTDKFLYKIYQANDGWVELKTLMTFGRMRQYRPEEKVVAALRALEHLVLSPNNELVRRKEPLKDLSELKTIRKRQTVHIEGFPHDLLQEEVEAWFHDKIAPHLPNEKGFNSIRRIRSRQEKKFFGVVDVEFKLAPDAEFFLEKIEVAYPEGVAKAVEGLTKEAEGSTKETEESTKASEGTKEAEGSTKETEPEKPTGALKKMSLLTFQEMRESSKRFGVNDVTKRRNSFNDRGKRGSKKFKGRRGEEAGEKAEPAAEAAEAAQPAAEPAADATAAAEPAAETTAAAEPAAESTAAAEPAASEPAAAEPAASA